VHHDDPAWHQASQGILDIAVDLGFPVIPVDKDYLKLFPAMDGVEIFIGTHPVDGWLDNKGLNIHPCLDGTIDAVPTNAVLHADFEVSFEPPAIDNPVY